MLYNYTLMQRRECDVGAIRYISNIVNNVTILSIFDTDLGV